MEVGKRQPELFGGARSGSHQVRNPFSFCLSVLFVEFKLFLFFAIVRPFLPLHEHQIQGGTPFWSGVSGKPTGTAKSILGVPFYILQNEPPILEGDMLRVIRSVVLWSGEHAAWHPAACGLLWHEEDLVKN